MREATVRLPPLPRAGWWLFLYSSMAVLILVSLFFVLIGRNPLTLLSLIWQSALGDGYAISETLVRATPILFCAMATALPARMGLITVGAEGQLYFGALIGTGYMLGCLQQPLWTDFPVMLVIAACAGAFWALIPALLKSGLGVNETISTLLINYVAMLLVTWVVYGPWKNPASQGWPATAEFPALMKPATFFDSRIHMGLWLALAFSIVLHVMVTRTRWGLMLDILRSNVRAAIFAGLPWRAPILLTMGAGGMLAGLAGILETASIQGRLQAGLSAGAGLSGFLVAWLARNHFLRIVPMSLMVGALLSSGDGLQMLGNVPSSISLVVQGLLFIAVLGVTGVAARWERSRE